MNKRRKQYWWVVALGFLLALLGFGFYYQYVPCGKPGIYNCKPTPVCVKYSDHETCEEWELK